ncbi:hypothetical protein T440DRAFT_435983, partial [Plenodomus tracheiphilus IPT5]
MALVEPNVTMEILVTHGLVPSVVAGSKSTSIGDAFVAALAGSSSSRSGTFDCAVASIETVRSDGQRKIAKMDSVRSLGLLVSNALTTKLKIILVDAAPSVEITDWPVASVSDAMILMQ